MMRPRLLFAFVIILGCAALPKVREDAATFRVRNMNWSAADVTVYCNSSPMLPRIHTLQTGETTSRRFDVSGCSRVGWDVTLRPSREVWRERDITVPEGAAVDIVIASAFSTSWFRVR